MRANTGMVDRLGNPVFTGDYLNFDEKEWGGRFAPERVPALTEFVAEFPLCGCYADVALHREVVPPPTPQDELILDLTERVDTLEQKIGILLVDIS